MSFLMVVPVLSITSFLINRIRYAQCKKKKKVKKHRSIQKENTPPPVIHIFKDNTVDMLVYFLPKNSLSKPVDVIFDATSPSIVF